MLRRKADGEGRGARRVLGEPNNSIDICYPLQFDSVTFREPNTILEWGCSTENGRLMNDESQCAKNGLFCRSLFSVAVAEAAAESGVGTGAH